MEVSLLVCLWHFHALTNYLIIMKLCTHTVLGIAKEVLFIQNICVGRVSENQFIIYPPYQKYVDTNKPMS